MQINPISFTQRKIRKVKVQNLQTRQIEGMHFVEYDHTKKDMEKLNRTQSEWSGPKSPSYAHIIYKHFIEAVAENNRDIRTFGLEDKRGNIQALCQTNSGEREILYDEMPKINTGVELSYLSVNPDNIHGSSKRQYSGVGSKMVASVIKEVKKEGKDYLALGNANPGFWGGIKEFQSYDNGSVKVLNGSDFTKCMKGLNRGK